VTRENKIYIKTYKSRSESELLDKQKGESEWASDESRGGMCRESNYV